MGRVEILGSETAFASNQPDFWVSVLLLQNNEAGELILEDMKAAPLEASSFTTSKLTFRFEKRPSRAQDMGNRLLRDHKGPVPSRKTSGPKTSFLKILFI